MADEKFTNPKQEFLNELISAREFQELELARISEKTKISLPYLEKLEAGEWDFLPYPYIRSFLKTYATSLGMNVGEVLERFDNLAGKSPPKASFAPDVEDRSSKRRASKSGTGRKKSSFRFALAESKKSSSTSSYSFTTVNKTSKIIAAVFAVVAVAVLILLWKPWVKEKEAISEIPFEKVQEEHQAMVDSAGEKPAKQDTTVLDSSRVKLVLQAKATENCYLKIHADMDTSAIANGILFQGLTQSYEADSLLFVVVGNAGGLELNLNGTELGSLGQSGRVITLTIDKTGIIKSQGGVQPFPGLTAPSSQPTQQ